MTERTYPAAQNAGYPIMDKHAKPLVGSDTLKAVRCFQSASRISNTHRRDVCAPTPAYRSLKSEMPRYIINAYMRPVFLGRNTYNRYNMYYKLPLRDVVDLKSPGVLQIMKGVTTQEAFL